MEIQSAPSAQRVTREDLYALVWAKPMSRLAEEFGISGNGLAKVCNRLDVPYPPRGHWAKKEAGKPVVTFNLPPLKDGIPAATDIYPTPPKPAALPEAEKSATVAAEKVVGVSVPDGIDHLHPRVKAWLVEHRQAQRERVQEGRRNGRDSWYARTPIPDLTERDLYRFRVTSALFTALEKAGGKIESSTMMGKITFLIDGHRVECSIVEKLVQSLKPREQARTWTAYPDAHQSGLASSGFLRVSITTYQLGKPQWVETDKKTIGDMLPGIVGRIMAAGPILEQKKREHEEWQRQSREAQARREEAQRLKEVDDKRWNEFRAFAENWEERRKLLAFIAEVEARAASEDAPVIAERDLVDWIAWAREHAEMLDPLRHGAAGMFEAVAKASKRW